jgi:para-nitrobenzyl esterase
MLMTNFNAAVALAALGAALAVPVTVDSPVVTTTSGQVRGAAEGALRVFQGIPYAAPPVGDLRWKPPASIKPWAGVRESTAP